MSKAKKVEKKISFVVAFWRHRSINIKPSDFLHQFHLSSFSLQEKKREKKMH